MGIPYAPAIIEHDNDIHFPLHKAFIILSDRLSLTSKENEVGMTWLFEKRQPDEILHRFLNLSSMKPCEIPWAINQDFNDFLYYLQSQFGEIGGRNVTDDGLSIPLTLVYLSYLYFGGVELKNECSDQMKCFYQYLSENTAKFIEENFTHASFYIRSDKDKD